MRCWEALWIDGELGKIGELVGQSTGSIHFWLLVRRVVKFDDAIRWVPNSPHDNEIFVELMSDIEGLKQCRYRG